MERFGIPYRSNVSSGLVKIAGDLLTVCGEEKGEIYRRVPGIITRGKGRSGSSTEVGPMG
jgi:hypothetical protein